MLGLYDDEKLSMVVSARKECAVTGIEIPAICTGMIVELTVTFEPGYPVLDHQEYVEGYAGGGYIRMVAPGSTTTGNWDSSNDNNDLEE